MFIREPQRLIFISCYYFYFNIFSHVTKHICLLRINAYKTDVNNYFHLEIVLFCEILNRTDGMYVSIQTDDIYENSDHYIQLVTVGRIRGSSYIP